MNESKYEYEENESNGYETEQYDLEEETVHNTKRKSYHSSNHKLVNIILCVSLVLCGAGKLAYDYYEYNEPEQNTVEVIEPIEEETPSILNTIISEAEKYAKGSDYQQAIDKYLQAIELEPDNKSFYIKVADLYYKLEEFNQEKEILNYAMNKFDDDIFSKKYNVVLAVENVINKTDVKRSGKYGSLYWYVDNNGFLEVAGDGEYA